VKSSQDHGTEIQILDESAEIHLHRQRPEFLESFEPGLAAPLEGDRVYEDPAVIPVRLPTFWACDDEGRPVVHEKVVALSAQCLGTGHLEVGTPDFGGSGLARLGAALYEQGGGWHGRTGGL